jgi:hypothetical protein
MLSLQQISLLENPVPAADVSYPAKQGKFCKKSRVHPIGKAFTLINLNPQVLYSHGAGPLRS